MPNRILREPLLKSRKYNNVTPAQRDLYIRLLLLADDFGRFNGDPVIISREAYPIDESMTSRRLRPLLEALSRSGLIVVYTVRGEKYIQIRNWQQRSRAETSKFPDPQETDAGHDNDGQLADTGPAQAHGDGDGDEDGDGGEDGAAAPGKEPESFAGKEGQGNDPLDNGFDLFWQAYPKKVAKKAAYKAWRKLRPGGTLMGEIMAGLARWGASPQWAEQQFIPNAATFLNGERWTDQPPLYVPKTAGGVARSAGFAEMALRGDFD